LNSEGIDLTSICSEWFITWFAKSLPVHSVLRVWDTLFLEGFKVLFRVAVGIFKQVEKDILDCPGFEEVMQQAKQFSRRQLDHNELLKASFVRVALHPMRRHDLMRDRKDALAVIDEEDSQLQQRRAEASAKRLNDAKLSL